MSDSVDDIVTRALAGGVAGRVFPLRWQKRRIWVKQAVPPKQKGWHRVQRFLANVTGIPMLRPTVSPGGQEGLLREAEILRRLGAADILVPDLLATGENWLAIGDNGVILQNIIADALRDGDDGRARDLVCRAGQALAQLHDRGFAHGAPLLRNMTIRDDDAIGFIDFEEDPNGRMPLADAQARDILLFVFSIQRGFKRRPELLMAGWNAYLEQAGSGAAQLPPVKRLMRILLPVYVVLRPWRRWLGTDAISALRAYGILRRSLRQKAIPRP